MLKEKMGRETGRSYRGRDREGMEERKGGEGV